MATLRIYIFLVTIGYCRSSICQFLCQNGKDSIPILTGQYTNNYYNHFTWVQGHICIVQFPFHYSMSSSPPPISSSSPPSLSMSSAAGSSPISSSGASSAGASSISSDSSAGSSSAISSTGVSSAFSSS